MKVINNTNEMNLKKLFDIAVNKRGITAKSIVDNVGMSHSGFYNSLTRGTMRFDILCKVSDMLGVSIAYFNSEMHDNYGDLYLYRKDKANDLQGKDLKIWEKEATGHCDLMKEDLEDRAKNRETESFIKLI